MSLPRRVPTSNAEPPPDDATTGSSTASGLIGAIALTTLAVDAGFELHRAVIEVARRAEGSAGAFLRQASSRVARGVALEEALTARSAELHPLIDRYARLLARASLDGQDLRGPLEALIDETRRHELAALDEAAQRASVMMTIPLVLCILPAFLLLAIAPLVISVVADLTP